MKPTKKFVVTMIFEADDTYGPLRMQAFMADHMDLHESEHYQRVDLTVTEAPLG